jgi:hypothetical protein
MNAVLCDAVGLRPLALRKRDEMPNCVCTGKGRTMGTEMVTIA